MLLTTSYSLREASAHLLHTCVHRVNILPAFPVRSTITVAHMVGIYGAPAEVKTINYTKLVLY